MSEGRFRRAYLGLVGGYRPLPPRLTAVIVGPRESASTKWSRKPAARRLRAKDVILDVDGAPLDSAGDLQRLMISDAIGRSLKLRVLREDKVIVELSGPPPRGESDRMKLAFSAQIVFHPER